MKNSASILYFLLALCVWFGGLYWVSEVIIAAYQRGLAIPFFITALIGVFALERGARLVFSLHPKFKELEA